MQDAAHNRRVVLSAKSRRATLFPMFHEWPHELVVEWIDPTEIFVSSDNCRPDRPGLAAIVGMVTGSVTTILGQLSETSSA